MHARDLVDLAAIVSCHARPLVEGPWRLSMFGVEQYWTASKCRFDRWGRTLKDIALDPTVPLEPRFHAWRATVEEILGSEILTRVWTAVLVAHDRRRGYEDASIIGRSIYYSHVELRNRALRQLVAAQSSILASEIDRLRRRSERWTDVLLAQLAGPDEVIEFAHDAHRVERLAVELRAHAGRPGVTADQVLIAAERIAFQQCFATSAPNPDANTRIAAGVLACLDSQTFDSTGLLPQLFSTRLLTTALDVEGLIGDLFADEAGTDVAFIRKRAI